MSTKKKKSVTFEFHAPEAESAFLAGTFNDWSTENAPMAKNDKGHWQAKLQLSPGKYEFKFFVDGEWCCAPGCDSRNYECPTCVVNEFGTMNRVIEVE